MEISTLCGCCSLRSGTIVIGTLNLISGCLLLLIAAPSAAGIVNDSNLNVLISAGGGAIAYILVYLILGLLLVIGAVKNKVNLIFPSVFISFGNIILSFGVSIMCIILTIINELSGVIIFLTFLFTGIWLCLQAYLWLVTFVFYKSLITEQILRASQRSISSDHRPLV